MMPVHPAPLKNAGVDGDQLWIGISSGGARLRESCAQVAIDAKVRAAIAAADQSSR